MVTFKATETSRDETLLADTLGYPKGWHVVREVDVIKGSTTHTPIPTFLDTIYAGPPDANSDTYYNHLAAMDAAMKWTEGESTAYDDNGGQMLPIQTDVELCVGDEVEVYYEPEAAYFAATVKKVVQYKDDVRYTVKYKLDRSTQSNVCIELIRLIKSKKKRKAKAAAAAAAAESDGTESKKKKAKKNTTPKSKAKAKTKAKVATPKATAFEPDPVALQVAADMGLPEGWSATVAPKSRFTFKSPDGKKKFYSKKAVYAHLGIDISSPSPTKAKSSTSGQKSKRRVGRPRKNPIKEDISKPSADATGEAAIEEGDPPWRTDGHKYLSKRVKYEYAPGQYAGGTVTGWISEDDVDKDGEPGFISEKTGKPAALFHIFFDTDSNIASQDLEEYELVEALVSDDDGDGDGDGGNSDDDNDEEMES